MVYTFFRHREYYGQDIVMPLNTIEDLINRGNAAIELQCTQGNCRK